MEQQTQIKANEFDASGRYDSGLKSMVKSLQLAFFFLVIVILGMLIYFFTFGGYFAVRPQEAVIVLRFGKYHDTYTSDWHWFLPYPVNSFIRVKTNPQTLALSFEAAADPLAPPDAPQGRSLEPGRDRYLLTADANIVHTSWSVNYHVADPRKYYEATLTPADPQLNDEIFVQEDGTTVGRRGPQTLLRSLLARAVVEVTSTTNITDVLYQRQTEYRENVQRRFTAMVLQMDIGIEIDGLNLERAIPPLKTKAAFDEVSAAGNTKSALIKQAEEYSVKEANVAEARKAELLAVARTYAQQVVSEVRAEGIYFQSIQKEYLVSPKTVLMALYNYTLSEVMTGDDKYILGTSGADRKQIRIKLNPEPKRKAARPAKEGK